MCREQSMLGPTVRRRQNPIIWGNPFAPWRLTNWDKAAPHQPSHRQFFLPLIFLFITFQQPFRKVRHCGVNNPAFSNSRSGANALSSSTGFLCVYRDNAGLDGISLAPMSRPAHLA